MLRRLLNYFRKLLSGPTNLLSLMAISLVIQKGGCTFSNFCVFYVNNLTFGLTMP